MKRPPAIWIAIFLLVFISTQQLYQVLLPASAMVWIYPVGSAYNFVFIENVIFYAIYVAALVTIINGMEIGRRLGILAFTIASTETCLYVFHRGGNIPAAYFPWFRGTAAAAIVLLLVFLFSKRVLAYFCRST